jgi:hypothetical protein
MINDGAVLDFRPWGANNKKSTPIIWGFNGIL